MTTYQIKDWNKYYETSRSRPVAKLQWVSVPNNHDGDGYAQIMSDPRAPEIFTAWILLIQVASKCRERGTLIRDDGAPLTIAAIARKTRGKTEWFNYAIPKLLEVGWITQTTVSHQAADTCPTLARQSEQEGNPSGPNSPQPVDNQRIAQGCQDGDGQPSPSYQASADTGQDNTGQDNTIQYPPTPKGEELASDSQTGEKRKSPMTIQCERFRKIFSYRPTTALGKAEEKAVASVGLVNDEDLSLVEDFYLTKEATEADHPKFRRTGLTAFLNNFNGEVTKARAWIAAHRKAPPRTPHARPSRSEPEPTSSAPPEMLAVAAKLMIRAEEMRKEREQKDQEAEAEELRQSEEFNRRTEGLEF